MAHRINVSTKLHRLLAFPLLLLLAGCSLAEPLIRGVVVEEGSNTPVPDATVYVMWMAYGPGAGHSRSGCAHIDFTKSDTQGGFELPGDGSAGLIQAYKPGYVWYCRVDKFGNVLRDPLAKPQTVLMKPFTGSVKERLEYLLHQTGKECGSNAEEIKTKIIPFNRALYEETRAVARSSPRPLTEEERKLASMTLYHTEKYELGMDEATKRLEARRLRGEY